MQICHFWNLSIEASVSSIAAFIGHMPDVSPSCLWDYIGIWHEISQKICYWTYTHSLFVRNITSSDKLYMELVDGCTCFCFTISVLCTKSRNKCFWITSNCIFLLSVYLNSAILFFTDWQKCLWHWCWVKMNFWHSGLNNICITSVQPQELHFQ
jgi:hypothetical protein